MTLYRENKIFKENVILKGGSVLLVTTLVLTALLSLLSAWYYQVLLYRQTALIKQRSLQDFYVVDGQLRVGIALAKKLIIQEKNDPLKKITYPITFSYVSRLSLEDNNNRHKKKIITTLSRGKEGIIIQSILSSENNHESRKIGCILTFDLCVREWSSVIQ